MSPVRTQNSHPARRVANPVKVGSHRTSQPASPPTEGLMDAAVRAAGDVEVRPFVPGLSAATGDCPEMVT